MDDHFLIEQVHAGNRNAFKFLVLRYQRPLFKFLHSFQLRPAEIEELGQETFLRAYKNLASFDATKGAFSSWLFTIAKNLALGEIARHSRKREVYADSEPEGAEETLADPAPGQHEELQRKALQTTLSHALSQIPTQFRNAVVLSYVDEMSLEEIASAEGCSVGTVKSRVFRGKAQLHAFLKKWKVFGP